MKFLRRRVKGAPGGVDRRLAADRALRREFDEDLKRRAADQLAQARELTKQTDARLRALRVEQQVMRRRDG